MLVYCLQDDAIIPSRAYDDAAGINLRAPDDYTIHAGATLLVNTGIGIVLPYGSYGRITEKSGLAATLDVSVVEGVMDRGNEGPVIIILQNNTDIDYEIARGEPLAQLICVRTFQPQLRESIPRRRFTRDGRQGLGMTDEFIKE